MYKLTNEFVKRLYKLIKKRINYADVKDTPSSLPANGGNADTVGGYSVTRVNRNNHIPILDEYGRLKRSSECFFMKVSTRLTSTETHYYKLFTVLQTSGVGTIVLDVFSNKSIYRKVFIEIDAGNYITNVKMTPNKYKRDNFDSASGTIYVVKTSMNYFDVYLESIYYNADEGFVIDGICVYGNSSINMIELYTNNKYQILTSLPTGAVAATEVE